MNKKNNYNTTNTNTDTDNDDEHIRTPDPIVKEQLVSYQNDIFHDFDEAIKKSLVEYDNIKNKDEENVIENERKFRLNKFNILKQKINKIIHFDKHNKTSYELVLSIIELYENNYINVYEMDQKEYNTILSLVSSLKIPKEEISEFLNIIQ